MNKLKDYLESPVPDLERELKEAKDEENRLAKELEVAKLRTELASRTLGSRVKPVAPRGR